jgi:hypothetical protein
MDTCYLMKKNREFHHIYIASGIHQAEEKYSADQKRLTMRAPDWWESARFQAFVVA